MCDSNSLPGLALFYCKPQAGLIDLLAESQGLTCLGISTKLRQSNGRMKVV